MRKEQPMNLRNALRYIYIYISAEPCESGVEV
nr:MAG TPA: hypothetical protein [Caudoviricetes sp.]